jgi:hypothetical protein
MCNLVFSPVQSKAVQGFLFCTPFKLNGGLMNKLFNVLLVSCLLMFSSFSFAAESVDSGFGGLGNYNVVSFIGADELDLNGSKITLPDKPLLAAHKTITPKSLYLIKSESFNYQALLASVHLRRSGEPAYAIVSADKSIVSSMGVHQPCAGFT